MTDALLPMQIQTFSGRTVDGPIDISNYWGDRKGHDLYRLMLAMAAGMFREARSAIDVGCFTSGLLVEMDWIHRRVATDIQTRLAENWKPVQGVEFVAGDAFAIDYPEKFDLVISCQTIEHLEKPAEFVEKLLSLGKGLLLSTTYETPHGLIKGHIQDPISLEKFQSWFPVPLDAWTVCYHPSRTIGHIIGVVAKH
jgi:2-polyprenyl-3-methyl-5-hydroxy-6-metoxy-1,4-benzoquinol methylase